MALINRQLTVPVGSPFDVPLLLVVVALALALAWPIRLWLVGRMLALLRAAAMEPRC